MEPRSGINPARKSQVLFWSGYHSCVYHPVRVAWRFVCNAVDLYMAANESIWEDTVAHMDVVI